MRRQTENALFLTGCAFWLCVLVLPWPLNGFVAAFGFAALLVIV